MSVVSDLHGCFSGKGKVISAGLTIALSLPLLLFTIVGIDSCKNVDKVSDSLIFRYNEDQSVSTLDPAYVKSQAELWIAGQVFNSLVDLDSQLRPVPMLASRWEISENGLVYKFHLRSGIRFCSNGNPSEMMSARDVVFSFNRLLDPVTASPAAWIFSDKVNTRGTIPPFQAADDSTFVLTLSKPFPAMLSLLATTYCSILPEALVKKDPQAFGRNPAGTGPFYVKFWETDVKLVLRKNKEYFEFDGKNRLPFLEAINVDFIKSKQTAFMKFAAGEYDFFNGMEVSFKDELLSPDGHLKDKYQGRFHMQLKPFLNTEYLGFWLDTSEGGKPNILQNVHLRKAMNYAIDRPALIRYLRNGVGISGENGFVPPVLLGKKVAGYGYRPDLAAQELKMAGYSSSKPCPVVTITTTADYLDLMVFLKKYWADIGITVAIDVQTSGMLRQMRSKGKCQIYRGSWIADYPDPENYLACFYSPNFSPNGPDYTHFQNEAVDNLYRQVAFGAGTSAELRLHAAAAADSAIMQEAPVIVLFYDYSIRLSSLKVKGLGNDPQNRLLLKRVRKATKSTESMSH